MTRTRCLRTLPLLLVAVAALTGCPKKPPAGTCQGDSDCENAQFCVEGQCQECRADSDCTAGNVCLSGRCGPKPECSKDSECQAPLVCKAQKCVPECKADTDCAAGFECQAQQCVRQVECTSPGDCPSGKDCVEGKCEPPKGASTSSRAGDCTLERIQFDFDSAEIGEAQRPILEANAKCLKETRTASHIIVEGHCDERGTSEYNYSLGERRATAARKYLVNLGVPAARLESVSFGEDRPLDRGLDEAAWAKNRRSELVER